MPFRLLPRLAVVLVAAALPGPARSQTAQITDVAVESAFQDSWFGHFKRGRACVAADFDLDGRIDFFVGNPGDESFVIRNVTGGDDAIRFEFVQTLVSGVVAWSAAAADYDNDGDHDLFIGCGANQGIDFDYLFRNMWVENGGSALTFVDVTATAGIAGPVPAGAPGPLPVATAGGAWGDVDRDGLPDLFVSVNIHNLSKPQLLGRNVLWRNNGDGTFTDVTTPTGLGATAYRTRHATFLDIENDGDLDLYESNMLEPNVLWRNLLVETGSLQFEDVTTVFSPPGEDLRYPYQTFASASADFDQNGFDDLIAFMRVQGSEPGSPYPDGHAIFLNQGGTGFVNVAAAAGVNVQLPDSNGVMGCQVGDLNADGVPDLFFGNGGPTGGTVNELFMSSSPVGAPLSYANWSDSIDFAAPEDSVLSYPSYPYRTHGTCFVDLNGNGTLEMAVANGGPSTSPDAEPNRLFTFDWTPAPTYLKVRPIGNGTTVSRDGIGTRVSITVRNGAGPPRDLHQTMWGGSAFSAQNGHELYFGLAGADTVESVRVLWTDGVTDTIPGGLPVSSSVVVVRDGSLPDGLCWPSEGPEAACGDGVDNDCDGFVDGADPDCSSAVTSVTTPAGETAWIVSRPAPNPFRDATTIRFEVPRAGPVHLAVYDTAGRLVRTLVSGDLDAGEHRARWSGRDEKGRPVATGMYFYRIRSAGRQENGKLLLTR